jgi:hypothetical protein
MDEADDDVDESSDDLEELVESLMLIQVVNWKQQEERIKELGE